MNNLRKYITPFILVIALFAINGSEFLHHHNNSDSTKQDDKCQACIFSHSLNSTLVEHVFVFTPQLLTFSRVFSIVSPVPQSEVVFTSPGRAPPAVSHI